MRVLCLPAKPVGHVDRHPHQHGLTFTPCWTGTLKLSRPACAGGPVPSTCPPPKRKKADQAARYLINKANHLDYPTALAAGWPIATGVIEGACRHLVRDRMDITGARWSADGAEAVLQLRAVRTNHDFDTYWHYHLNRERQRVHQSRYLDAVIPTAA